MDLTDKLKLFRETPETIRARLLADTNAGIDPNDSAYADYTAGQFVDDLHGAATLEFDREWDALNQVAAAAIPATSSGAHLDQWAASLGRSRNPAAKAGGVARFEGPEGADIPNGTAISTPQTAEDDEPVGFLTTEAAVIPGAGFIDVPFVAEEAGASGKVPANTITLVDTPLEEPSVTVTNPLPTTGGSDVEGDPSLLRKILRKLSGTGGGGNQDFYIDEGLNYPGVGNVTVQPNWDGLGTVRMIVTDEDNNPMPDHAVDGLQVQVDPSDQPAQGAGTAPAGATVTVATPASAAITVEAELLLSPGYSLDGTGGTRAVREPIRASLARYIAAQPAGGTVLWQRGLAAILDAEGVIVVPELSLNGLPPGEDVEIDQLEVALLSTLTLSVAP